MSTNYVEARNQTSNPSTAEKLTEKVLQSFDRIPIKDQLCLVFPPDGSSRVFSSAGEVRERFARIRGYELDDQEQIRTEDRHRFLWYGWFGFGVTEGV